MTGPPDAAATRGFYAIAHRAGNNLHELEEALEVGVDAIECDFWHARGRLALRHERKLPAIPLLFDKWYVRWQWGELSLRRLLRAINFRTELFLDIKSATPRAADAVLELYHDNESMMPRTRVSSKQWNLLDRIARAGTDMEMYYSIGRGGSVDRLLQRARIAPRPHGTSIRHSLLSSRDVIERLHEADLRVFAWTVNRLERAEELIDWGVDGIISDELDVLRLPGGARAGSGAPPSP
jgi:glycerophosphoryl diester phosphodiesterase